MFEPTHISSTPSVRPLRLPVVPARPWLAVRGLQLLIGSSGQISLGHGAFFAVGAYTAGVLRAHQRLPSMSP